MCLTCLWLFSDSRYFLDFVQFIQRFERCQAIDVESGDFVTDLKQHGVFQLEEAQLDTFPLVPDVCHIFLDVSVGVAVVLELFQDFGRAFDDGFGQSCHLSYLDTERVVRAAFYQFAEEYYFVAYFFDRYVEVLDFGERAFHLVQLVVVGGKQCFCSVLGILVQEFDDSPSDGYSVIRGSTAS